MPAAPSPNPSPPVASGSMQPLSSLPPPRLASLVGVLTDIDDTLTLDGQIEPAALQALHQLQRADVPVVAITGRPAGWSEPMVRDWPVAAIVAENGAVMLRRDSAAADGLRRDFVANEATRAAHQRRLQACAAEVLALVRGASLAQDSPGRLTDIAIDHSEFTHMEEPAIAQVVQLMCAHGLTATVSSIHINGWIGQHNKFSGAAWAVEVAVGRHFDPEQWIYVGDSTNDQVMFERMPLTVGVANIARFVPQLRFLPSHVSLGERGQGFAEVAQALLAAQGRG